MIFGIIIIQAWRADTKVSAEHINESGPSSTEGDSIGESSVMWEDVLIARREKVNLSCAANRQGMSKPLFRLR